MKVVLYVPPPRDKLWLSLFYNIFLCHLSAVTSFLGGSPLQKKSWIRP